MVYKANILTKISSMGSSEGNLRADQKMWQKLSSFLSMIESFVIIIDNKLYKHANILFLFSYKYY